MCRLMILFIYVLATIPRVALFILGISAIIGPIGLLFINRKLEAEPNDIPPSPVDKY